MMISLKKVVVICVLLLTSKSLTAQSSYHIYRKNRVFMGVLGGVNFTMPQVLERHSVLVETDGRPDMFEKDYGDFSDVKKNLGVQFGFFASYSLTNHFSIVFQPQYYAMTYHYMNEYGWTDNVTQMNFFRELLHRQQVNYFSLPLMVKWDWTTSMFSPYLQVGGYVNFRHTANKSIYYDSDVDGEVIRERPEGATEQIGVREYYRKFDAGITGGIGFSIYTPVVTISLETNLRYSFVPAIDPRMRYTDANGLASQYMDVFDQKTLAGINVQAILCFPVDNLRNLNILRKSRSLTGCKI